jgi:kexin
MRISKALVALSLAITSNASKFYRDYTNFDYFAVQLAPSIAPSEVAKDLGATWEGPLGELPDHHTFSSPRHRSHEVDGLLQELRRRRRKREVIEGRDTLNGILWSQKQKLKPRLQKRIPPPPLNNRQGPPPAKDKTVTAIPEALKKLDGIADTLEIRDPIFKGQWHLFNPVQLGHDLNITGLWLQGITGNGSITAVIDDGLDMYSDDLKDNYYAHGSYDFNDMRDEPKPELDDDKHGTRCAGEIAAVRNDVCGVGVAYDSMVAGIRILSKLITDENEAIAVNYGFQHNQIYSCSWGPPDDGVTMDAPGLLIQRAMVNGVQHGRKGKGSIFVFAAGNGAGAEDNCNFDGYTNSIYSITVGAIDREGNHPYYSEKCSAQLVVAYSSGRMDAIHTTDVGTNKCYNGHGGTSAAGPLAAGVYALALSIRPDLNWRDLQHLTVLTAVPVHEDDGSWQETTIGRKFSHTFGYGKVDGFALVSAASDWKSVKPQAWYHSPWLRVNHPIPQGDQGLASSFEITEDALKQANFERLEHVTVTMNVNHTRRGDLSVELKSPAGIVSHLSTTRRMDNNGDGYVDWTFMSVAHW